jgi:glutathione S-transferase
MSAAKHTLYDMPVSNNGARCRLILYKKQLDPSEVDIVPPSTLEGGLKGPVYAQLNPQQKMPLLVIHHEYPDGGRVRSLPESDTIARYLLSRYSDHNPSFLPNHATSNLLCRIHDVYISSIQGCMYKATPPFGTFGTRSEALQELRKQLNILDDVIQQERGPDDSGLYLLGHDVSLADATLFPTMVFIHFILPKFGIPQKEALPKYLQQWFHRVRLEDASFAKVDQEVRFHFLSFVCLCVFF